MALTLGNLHPSKGSKRSKKRVGRGNSSGHGTYSTRGMKGQRARSGSRKGLKLKGLKSRLQKIPKLGGFLSPYGKMSIVNLKDLEKAFSDNAEVTPKKLVELGLVMKTSRGVKVLGSGKLAKKLNIKGCLVSASAKEAITKAGGKVL